MDYIVTTEHLEPRSIVSIRDRNLRGDLPGFLAAAFPELFERLRVLGVSPVGAPFVIYHEFGVDGIDAEVCLPVPHTVAAEGRVQSRSLPAMTVARTLHVGPYEDLGAAYGAVSAWVARHGFEGAGPIQERYLNGPGDGVAPGGYRTEIEMPIIPLHVTAPA